MNLYLFCDIDGVLNTRPGSLDSDKIELLKGLCEDHRPKIVISSDWRTNENMMERLSDVLGRAGIMIHGVTPVLPKVAGLPSCEVREREIAAFLKSESVSSLTLTILDDMFLPKLGGYQVRPEPKVGLTSEDLKGYPALLDRSEYLYESWMFYFTERGLAI